MLIKIANLGDQGFYAKIEPENCILEGDFVFFLNINRKSYSLFWLNSNFIPTYLIAKNNEEIIIAPEEFALKYLSFSSLSVFRQKGKSIQENNESKAPLNFNRNLLSVHPEVVKYLTKKIEIDRHFNSQNKKFSLKYCLESVGFDDLDMKKMLRKSNLIGENFGVHLIFLEN